MGRTYCSGSSDEQILMIAKPTATGRALERTEILVVEDNWHAATSIKRWLEAAGAHVIGPASNTKIGQLLGDLHRPDVAVLDLNLGGRYAYPLIDWLNARGVPVIVVSAYSYAGEVTPNLGAILAKPVEEPVLIEAVRDALDSRTPRSRGPQ
jgi:CheY-like chemotaxis protein